MGAKRRQYFFVAAVIIGLTAAVYWTSLTPRQQGTGYGDVTVQRAKELIDSNPALVILDVRTKSEYDSGHIKGSILIPLSELEKRISELSKEDELLVYCGTGKRSSQAVNILQTHGYTRVYNMVGGLYRLDTGRLLNGSMIHCVVYLACNTSEGQQPSYQQSTR